MISKLFKFIKGYGKPALLAPLCVIIEVICELILPRLMSGIIDIGVNGDGGFSYILRTGAVMLALAVCSMLTGVASAKFASTASQGFGANLRKAMFDTVQDFSFADIDRFSSASLITRLTNDVNTIQQMVGMGLRILVRAPMILIVALLICRSINARLTLILLAVVPFMAVCIGLLMSACRKLFRAFQERIDGLNASVQENLIAIRVVKAFVREDYERKKFRERNDALRAAAIKTATRVVFMHPIMQICFNIAIVFVLWFGGQYVIGGTLLTGGLYFFLS